MANELILILLGTILVNNVVLVHFLDASPIMGTSSKLDTAIGMSLATTCVLTLSSALSYLLFVWLLKPFQLEYLQTLSFMLVIATIVQVAEMVIKKNNPVLHRTLGLYLPLITANCAVLGVALLNVHSEDTTLLTSIVYGFGTAVGFSLVLILFAAMRERIALADVPEPFKGSAIGLITTGFMALAFMGFAGLVSIK